MDTQRRLQDAAKAAEVLTIVYHGGSQPGTKRVVSPISVDAKYVRARCLATNQIKSFLVANVQIVSDLDCAEDYDPTLNEGIDEADNISAALTSHISEFGALGWHVEISESAISLHRYFRDGRPHKGADMGITNSGDDTARPWYVYGPSVGRARSFSHLGRACSLLLEEARRHAPRQSSSP